MQRDYSQITEILDDYDEMNEKQRNRLTWMTEGYQLAVGVLRECEPEPPGKKEPVEKLVEVNPNA